MPPKNLMLIAAPLRGKFGHFYSCQVGLSTLLVDVSIDVLRCGDVSALRQDVRQLTDVVFDRGNLAFDVNLL
jgi:hypothetical protein